MADLFTTSSADISECGKFRYSLFRRWGEGPTCTFIMLNPSTADADQDDPTIRRCIGFAKREGCGALRVVNLFAYRSKNPDDLLLADDPCGPRNAAAIDDAIGASDGPIIAAWGSAKYARPVGDVIRRYPDLIMCLGINEGGGPRHPLYCLRTSPLIRFSGGD